MKKLAISIIKFYQRWVSPMTQPRCRFEPSCSSYAAEAIDRFGLAQGVWLGIKRLAKCHPFHASGYDPVPGENCSQQKTSSTQCASSITQSPTHPEA